MVVHEVTQWHEDPWANETEVQNMKTRTSGCFYKVAFVYK